jgi:hypothetical protein
LLRCSSKQRDPDVIAGNGNHVWTGFQLYSPEYLSRAWIDFPDHPILTIGDPQGSGSQGQGVGAPFKVDDSDDPVPSGRVLSDVAT